MGPTTEGKKISFRGALSFPVQIDGAGAADPPPYDPALLDTYFANNERGIGGWYPLGGAQMWHNGIHLHTGSIGRKVYAMAAGTIVAARLGEDEAVDSAKFPFGSPRFVLIRHQLSLIDDAAQRRSWDTDTWKTRDVTFYSLYMHIDTTSSKSEEVPWLRTYRGVLKKGSVIKGKVYRLKNPGRAGAWLHDEPKPKDGMLAGEPTAKRHLTGGERFELLEAPAIKAKLAKKKEEPVEVVYAKVKELVTGTEGWLRIDGGRTEDDPTGLKELQNGGVAVLTNLTVGAGECIGHSGPLQPEGGSTGAPPQYGVHVEVFSEERLVPKSDANWSLLEDTSEADVICDIRSLLGEKSSWLSWFEGPPRLTRDHYAKFLGQFATQRVAHRRAITRNTSFWAIDWPAMMKESANKEWKKNFDIPDATIEAANRYSWWGDAKSAGLPKDALVHHYHPLEIMQYLADRVPRPPVFYVTREDPSTKQKADVVVSKPTHLERDGEKQEVVMVYEHDRDPWLIGGSFAMVHSQGLLDVHGKNVTTGQWQHGKGFVGLVRNGTPNLYAALVGTPEPSLAGLPVLAGNARNIWAAIWHSEGGLDAINTWDNGFLSAGGLQQTAGVVSGSGTCSPIRELGGALHAVKMSSGGQALLDRYFTRYGMDTGAVTAPGLPATRSLKIDTAPPSPGGAAELASGSGAATVASYERLRWFIWSYCAVRALQDPEFKARFYAHGFTRLDLVRSITKPFGTEPVRVDRLLKTELGQALVLDTHINTTENGATVWSQAAHAAPVNLSASANIDWTSFAQPQPGAGYTIGAHKEYQIIANMIALRRSPSTMVDGPARSAFIVLCCAGLSYPGKHKKFDQAEFDAYRVSADPFANKVGYPGGITQVMREALGVPASTPPSAMAYVLNYTYGFLQHLRPANE